MQLHIVVSGGDGEKAVAVFSTRDRALTFIDERGVRDARVEERALGAEYEYPAAVHAAHSIDQKTGLLVFAGVYAKPEVAAKAAGGGEVVTLRPDAKQVENIH